MLIVRGAEPGPWPEMTCGAGGRDGRSGVEGDG